MCLCFLFFFCSYVLIRNQLLVSACLVFFSSFVLVPVALFFSMNRWNGRRQLGETAFDEIRFRRQLHRTAFTEMVFEETTSNEIASIKWRSMKRRSIKCPVRVPRIDTVIWESRSLLRGGVKLLAAWRTWLIHSVIEFRHHEPFQVMLKIYMMCKI